jgi:hypothetical protein
LSVGFSWICGAHQIESAGLDFDQRQINLAFLFRHFAAN